MSGEKVAAKEGSNLSAALSEAESIITAAEERAARLVADAEKALVEARSKGYQEGFEVGRIEATKQSIRLMGETGAVSEKLAKAAASLALDIAEHLIGKAVEVTPNFVAEVAQRAVSEIAIGQAVKIIAHPDDAEVLKAAQKNLSRAAHGAEILFDFDETFQRGGCLVRSEFGEVDAQIEALLDGVRNEFGLA